MAEAFELGCEASGLAFGVAAGVIVAAHVLVHPGDDCHAIRRELEQMLEQRFKIDHTTLQVDHNRAGELLTIRSDPARRPR